MGKQAWFEEEAVFPKLKEGDAVQEHIRIMTEIFEELAVIGAPVKEEDRVVHLLASLPESYNTLVTALKANSDVPQMEVQYASQKSERKYGKSYSTLLLLSKYRQATVEVRSYYPRTTVDVRS